MGEHQYLAFNVGIMKLLNLWPDPKTGPKLKWKRWKSYAFFVTTLPTSLPIICETVLGFYEEDIDLVTQVQSLSVTICVFGMLYMAFCFLRNSERVKDVVDHVDTFQAYSQFDIKIVDKRATYYSKLFMSCTIFGMLCYSCAPLISRGHCERNRFVSMVKYGIPCGPLTRFRLPFRYDKSPLYEFFTVHTIFVAAVTSVVIANVTLLICGLLFHAVHHLKQLRKLLLEISDRSENDIVDAMHFTIRYHIAIIEFVDKVNVSFGSQLLIWLTLSSSVISILGFEIIMLSEFAEVVRFGVWLAGLCSLFYLTCHFGQLLIDESNGVADAAYSSQWYTCPVHIQKDIKLVILRSQKPLTLTAVSVGTFSARTFLHVLSSSYSYFTLLLNLK